MIDYSNVPGDQFEQVFSNISDAILHYEWWGHMGSNFFDSYCINCGTIRYYDIPRDYYLVKKDCYNLLVCKDCWEEIELYWSSLQTPELR